VWFVVSFVLELGFLWPKNLLNYLLSLIIYNANYNANNNNNNLFLTYCTVHVNGGVTKKEQ